jgi:hypothetical protein
MPPVEPSDATDQRELPHKPLRASWTVVGGAALAAVTALVLWLSSPGFFRLPPYRLELLDPKGAAPRAGLEGGPAPARVELAPGRGLTLLLSPDDETREAIEVITFLAARGAADAQAVPVVAAVEAAASGGLRLTLGPSALPDWGRLIVLVGRRGAVPRSASMGSADHGHGWQRFEVAFQHP